MKNEVSALVGNLKTGIRKRTVQQKTISQTDGLRFRGGRYKTLIPVLEPPIATAATGHKHH